MKNLFSPDEPERHCSAHMEIDRLLNLISSRLRRKEVALAEEFTEELLAKIMNLLLHQKAARMNRLNRLLLFIMKLLLCVIFVSLVCMVMDIQPLLSLKIFAGVIIIIALLIVLNYYMFGRFCRAVQLMTETYRKDSKLFKDLILDSIRVNDDPETALHVFRLAIMR